MVVWKGEIERRHGEKAYNLDNTDLEVPNFFVITSEEIAELFKTRDPNKLRKTSINLDEIMEAYKEVGMSSEVRNASNRARNLVGGQRGNAKVTVRASDNGFSEFKLDVGASGLEDAIKNVVASYLENNGSELPNIVVQKMIEADYTGTLIKGRKDYVEVVEGLGIALEDGKTRPSRYLIGENNEFKSPEYQVKVTQNPMTGGFREKRIENPEKPFKRSKIKEFAEKASNSVKFVYKRGSFFAVDVFNEENYIEDLKQLKVSQGEMKGTVGQEITLSDETLPPEKYENSLIARKGGYISTDAQKARRSGKPAIFSSDLKEGEKINKTETEDSFNNDVSESFTATNIKTVRELETSYNSKQAYLENYADVFDFEEGGEAIFDVRRVSEKGLLNALDYLEGDITILMNKVDSKILEKIVWNDFDVGVESSEIEKFESALRKVEHKFVVDRLREME